MSPASTFAARAAALALFLALSASTHAADPRGRFITASGNLEVDVAPCGEALCGTVSRVLANQSMSSPGAAMQAADGRDPLGLPILRGFVPAEFDAPAADGTREPRQWRGEVYNRENGKHYAALLSVDERGDLVLRAYVLLPLFGKTQVWTRVAAAAAAR
ncbi:DUF2147 domain-containing protein [Aquincola sp. S2]|uniref:DUF2147 domain-containing protein n=1 Tax=Pseudaquabacterium terrae TaxID=2732868 RepID=A0ABX2EQM8_9BURK|nr:DUF2147 domain-containing protein [Aquabacterium terrae]NRF70941.1 DUF2147 domain-containing protein [Aquabacterium terrae]